MNNGFPLIPLKEVVKPIERLEIPTTGKIYRQIGVRLWGGGAYERESIDGSQTRYQTLSCVEKDDIIVNKIWARNGSVAVVTQKLAGCYGSSEFPTFEPNRAKLEPRWFNWLTKTKNFWEKCDEKSQGTSGKNRIRPEQFLELTIPLPPLEEQQRIVARIEEARGLRRKTVEEVDVLLAAVLRENRDCMLQGNHPKAKLGDVTKVSAGGTPLREVATYWDGNIPWIKTGELLDGDIYRAEEYISQDGLNNSSAKLFPPETILIALYGQGQTRGRTGRLMIMAATNQACCAILPSTTHLEPRFIQYWLRSLYSEMRESSHGGAQPNWNGQMIKNIQIVLSPLSEQHRIVAYLDDLQAKVDALKQLQAENQAELDSLTPSILDKAFKGELV